MKEKGWLYIINKWLQVALIGTSSGAAVCMFDLGYKLAGTMWVITAVCTVIYVSLELTKPGREE